MAKGNNQQGVAQVDENVIASLVINGDLSKLSPEQKVAYYRQYCNRLGLDPISQPFKILRLNGKEVMYCDRSGGQQLNKVHEVSHEIMTRELMEAPGVFQVTARALLPGGRHTESIGAVSIIARTGEFMRGEDYANAMMKAETKAKRRSTLDLLGLGILDESEVKEIPEAEPVETPYQDITPTPETKAPAKPDAKEAQKNTSNNEETKKPEQAAPETNPFKKIYTEQATLLATLSQAKNTSDVAALYYANAEYVEKEPALKSSFTSKKESLTQTKVTPEPENQQASTLAEPVHMQDIFSKLYTKKPELLAVIAKASTGEQLMAIYNANIVAIKQYKELQDALTARKLEIQNQAQQQDNTPGVFSGKSEPEYEQKYDNDIALEGLLRRATSTSQIVKLYSNNALIMDRTKALKDLSEQRLKEIKEAGQNK